MKKSLIFVSLALSLTVGNMSWAGDSESHSAIEKHSFWSLFFADVVKDIFSLPDTKIEKVTFENGETITTTEKVFNSSVSDTVRVERQTVDGNGVILSQETVTLSGTKNSILSKEAAKASGISKTNRNHAYGKNWSKSAR